MLTVIIKGTNSCNLACSYCSLGKKENIKCINEKSLTDILHYVCKVCEYRNEKELTLILHGGEPTLVPAEVYDKALQAVMLEFPDLHIKVLMQTNGMAMQEDMLTFIKKYDISVGVSIDGSKKIHDVERCSAAGEATYDRVTANIDRLLQEGIGVSCLMVLTSHALIESFDFLDYFEKRNLHLKINPLLNYGEVYEHPELSLKEGEYAEYLIRLYRYVVENDRDICISPLDKILQGILYENRITECTFCSDCNKDFLCIDYNGDIYPCGKYADMSEYRIGNIKEGNYNLLETPIMKNLLSRRSTTLPEACAACKYVSFCHAGCNAEASIDGNIKKAPVLCADYKRLFDFFHGEGLLLLRQQLVQEKNRLERVQNGV